MIGFYDYTVVLTYISLASSLTGMFLACSGNIKWSVFCLAMSGLLDAFDGKVARTKKNRTQDEKDFGIQIDSLCDIVCFGVLPVVICWASGMREPIHMVLLVLYCLGGLIRLAFFNVMEGKRQKETSENRKYYQGMPITSVAVILPMVYLCAPLFEEYFNIVLSVVMALTGFLFVLNFRFPKLTSKGLAVLMIVVAVVVVYLLFYYNWKEYFHWNIKEYLQEKLQWILQNTKKN